MARQKGVFKFSGTIDGVSYYESKYGALVRKKGGPTGEQVKRSGAFKRVRENLNEFGNCGKATKLLRAVIRPLLKDASDFLVTGRMNKLMFALKNLDATSARGERKVAAGIATPGAEELIRGFDFNAVAPLRQVLKKSYTINTSTGVISIAGLKPKQDLEYPKGATHVKITGGWVRIDFGSGKGTLNGSNSAVLPLNGVLNNVVLTPGASPSGSGTNLFLLQILFYQELNGVSYELKNGENNAMAIVEVA